MGVEAARVAVVCQCIRQQQLLLLLAPPHSVWVFNRASLRHACLQTCMFMLSSELKHAPHMRCRLLAVHRMHVSPVFWEPELLGGVFCLVSTTELKRGIVTIICGTCLCVAIQHVQLGLHNLARCTLLVCGVPAP
jgi:hypothetical protein